MLLFVLSFLGMVRTFQKSKCKKLLETTIARVQILRGRREVQLCHLLRQVAQLMNCGKNRKAQMQLECLWIELCLLSLYIKVQEYCDKVRINISIIAGQRHCPIDLEESVASLCFVASRCSVFPELQELREIFAMKYGSDFVISAQELKDNSYVDRSLLDFLSTKGPPEDLKEELNEYVLKKSDKKDGGIPKELLEILNRSTRANEANESNLFIASLKSEEYKQYGGLEEENKENKENKVLILNEGQNVELAQSCSNARVYDMNASLDNMSSLYGKYTYNSQFKRICRRVNKRKTKDNATKHVETWDYMFPEGEDDDGTSVAREEAKHMSNYYANDNGSSEEDIDGCRMHWNHNHVETTFTNPYGSDCYINPSSLLRLPHECEPSLVPRRPPPLPRVASIYGIEKAVLVDASLGRSSTLDDYATLDYEHVVARVAELSAKIRTK